VSEKLPVSLTKEDVENFPEFTKVLHALSGQLNPEGTSSSTDKDLKDVSIHSVIPRPHSGTGNSFEQSSERSRSKGSRRLHFSRISELFSSLFDAQATMHSFI